MDSVPKPEAARAELTIDDLGFPLPTEDDLPFEDGRVHNFDEHPQSMLLTQCALPTLRRLNPDGKFLIGQDSGIYFRAEVPAEKSRCVSPDWYYVPGVAQKNERGRNRKSYLMWRELRGPLIAIEFASNGGAEERDATPEEGKFWIYEKVLRVPYYAICVFDPPQLELYQLATTGYEPVRANEAGRYPIPPMRMELGLWRGSVLDVEQEWVRWWSDDGMLLPTDADRADENAHSAREEKRRADEEKRRADVERHRADAASAKADALAARLRALGIDPDAA